jgi:hypothetical protein
MANSRLSVEPWHAQGAGGEVRVVNFGDIALGLGGTEQTLRPPLLLEKPSVNDKLTGNIGMDVLNSAKSVTWDFRAMRLTLE